MSGLKLPFPDQVVLLARGEAGLLARAVAVLVRDVTQASRPVAAVEVLACLPLARLARQLYLLHRRELEAAGRPRRPGRPAPRPRPRALRVGADQLAALLLHHAALPYCELSAEEQLLLPGVVGKFQQQALNLAPRIRF